METFPGIIKSVQGDNIRILYSPHGEPLEFDMDWKYINYKENQCHKSFISRDARLRLTIYNNEFQKIELEEVEHRITFGLLLDHSLHSGTIQVANFKKTVGYECYEEFLLDSNEKPIAQISIRDLIGHPVEIHLNLDSCFKVKLLDNIPISFDVVLKSIEHNLAIFERKTDNEVTKIVTFINDCSQSSQPKSGDFDINDYIEKKGILRIFYANLKVELSDQVLPEALKERIKIEFPNNFKGKLSVSNWYSYESSLLNKNIKATLMYGILELSLKIQTPNMKSNFKKFSDYVLGNRAKDFNRLYQELSKECTSDNKFNYSLFYSYLDKNQRYFIQLSDSFISSVGDRILYTNIAEMLGVTIAIYEMVGDTDVVSYFNPYPQGYNAELKLLLKDSFCWIVYSEENLRNDNYDLNTLQQASPVDIVFKSNPEINERPQVGLNSSKLEPDKSQGLKIPKIGPASNQIGFNPSKPPDLNSYPKNELNENKKIGFGYPSTLNNFPNLQGNYANNPNIDSSISRPAKTQEIPLTIGKTPSNTSKLSPNIPNFNQSVYPNTPNFSDSNQVLSQMPPYPKTPSKNYEADIITLLESSRDLNTRLKKSVEFNNMNHYIEGYIEISNQARGLYDGFTRDNQKELEKVINELSNIEIDLLCKSDIKCQCGKIGKYSVCKHCGSFCETCVLKSKEKGSCLWCSRDVDIRDRIKYLCISCTSNYFINSLRILDCGCIYCHGCFKSIEKSSHRCSKSSGF
jgi:hypothetical protein